MKKITHHFGADLEWIKNFTNQFGGTIEGNHIVLPENISTGERYFLECEPGIVAYYVDVTYQSDFTFIQENKMHDFIGLYYNLTEGEIKINTDTFSCNIGRWLHNMIIIDSALRSQYEVKSGSRTLALSIFIKKELIIAYFKEYHNQHKKELIMNSCRNTNIRTHRMNVESMHALDKLSKINTNGILFDLNLSGTVNLLINDYLKKLSEENEILEEINEIDLFQIISTQKFLVENFKIPYPGNEVIAEKANMSKSKFIRLFKRINNDTPGNFFITNKLIKAKELLEENRLSVTQISEQLNINNSHFCSMFKCFFGISPKTFIKQIQRYDNN
ncbi:AraC-like DNA-binding protein [Flavobacterium sp. 9]|uniref:helix-turn-helix domain-containing protein n=1 Tax=Flavobacterium sp. 9 TaxID=2035198 RepID=UPI000C1A03A4|nr:helix-turn-helix transcriptional regulator [Flavobacterium sp. 9]PIF30172.1 AraC-like DNA-binding protein [Flavobacterium sp. 9]